MKLQLSRNLMNDTLQFYVGYYKSTQAKQGTKYCKTKNSASVWVSECVSEKLEKQKRNIQNNTGPERGTSHQHTQEWVTLRSHKPPH